jgi:hypothetical protein
MHFHVHACAHPHMHYTNMYTITRAGVYLARSPCIHDYAQILAHTCRHTHHMHVCVGIQGPCVHPAAKENLPDVYVQGGAFMGGEELHSVSLS